MLGNYSNQFMTGSCFICMEPSGPLGRARNLVRVGYPQFVRYVGVGCEVVNF